MPRYAVLHALEGAGLPIGLVIERNGFVHVDVLNEYGFARIFREEYRVLGRDLTEIVYRPGDPGYFDQVLVELARHAVVGEQGTIPDTEWSTVARLAQDKVADPRMGSVTGSWVFVTPKMAMSPVAHPVYDAMCSVDAGHRRAAVKKARHRVAA